MITHSAQMNSLLKVPTEGVVAARLYYGDDTEYLSIAEIDITLDGESFMGVLNKTTKPKVSVDWRRNTQKIGGGTMSIDNKEYQLGTGVRFSDEIENALLGTGFDVGFVGRRLWIKYFKKGVTTWANASLVSDAIMKRPKGHDRDTIVIPYVSKVTNFDKQEIPFVVGASEVVSEDGDIGAVKPIICDIRRTDFCNLDATQITFTRPSNAMKMRFMGAYRDGSALYAVSSHVLWFLENNSSHSIWAKDPESGRLVRLKDSYKIVQNDSRGALVLIGVGGAPNYYDYRLPDDKDWSTDIFDGGDDGAASITNAGNVVDINNSTLAEFDVTDGALGTDPYARMTLAFEPSGDPGGVVVERAVFARSKYTFIGTGDAGTYEINGVGAKASTPTTYDQFGSLASPDDTVLIDLTGKTASPDSYEAEVNMVFLRTEFTPVQAFQDVYVLCSGLLYGSWLAGRSGHPDSVVVRRSGVDFVSSVDGGFSVPSGGLQTAGVVAGDVIEISGGPNAGSYLVRSVTSQTAGTIHAYSTRGFDWPDNSESGQTYKIVGAPFIRNGVGLIEWVLRELGGLLTADIDTDSYDVAATSVATLTLGTYSQDVMSISKYIASVGNNVFVFPFWGIDGKHKCVAMRSAYVSGDVVKTIPYAEMKKFVGDSTNDEDIKGSVVMKYGQNGDKRLAEVGPIESSGMLQKYGLTAEEGRLTLLSDFFSSSTVATSVATKKLKYLQQYHNILPVDVGEMYSGLEAGDVIAVSDLVDEKGNAVKLNGEIIDDGNYSRAGQFISPYFMLLEVEDLRGVKAKGLQLHNLG